MGRYRKLKLVRNYGKLVRYWRIQNDVSLRELARLADIPPSTLCEIEAGSAMTTLDQAEKISRATYRHSRPGEKFIAADVWLASSL